MTGQINASTSDPDIEGDKRQLASAVANFFRDRKLIVVSSRVQVSTWLLDFFRLHDLPAPFMVLGDTDGVPAGTPSHQLEVVGKTVDAWLRVLEERLLSPPDSLMTALDAYDPGREALVFTPPLPQGVDRVLGRRCIGWRRPHWARYEDKTVSDSLWARAGVPTMPSVVTALTPVGLAAAFDSCDRGEGVVISADTTQGVHSGSNGVVRARDRAALAIALDFLAGRCEQVRVASFVEGMSCTIHGMVFTDQVAVYRPIEQVILREDNTFFPLLGGNALWAPTAEDQAAARVLVQRVGERLRTEADYRGSFGVDAIFTADGFQPIEVNARMGGFIFNGGPAVGVPLDLIHAMVAEGEETGIDPSALERVMVDGFDRSTQTRLNLPLVQQYLERSRALSLRHIGSGYRTTDPEGPYDAVVHQLSTPVGSRLMLEFPARPLYSKVALGPFAIAAIKAATRAWQLPTVEYSYSTVLR